MRVCEEGGSENVEEVCKPVSTSTSPSLPYSAPFLLFFFFSPLSPSLSFSAPSFFAPLPFSVPFHFLSPPNPTQPSQCSITKSSALVCWLGHESLQTQCLKLVTDLWSHGVAADLAYESQELDSMEDIQVSVALS